jgi:hypothetical protein
MSSQWVQNDEGFWVERVASGQQFKVAKFAAQFGRFMAVFFKYCKKPQFQLVLLAVVVSRPEFSGMLQSTFIKPVLQAFGAAVMLQLGSVLFKIQSLVSRIRHAVEQVEIASQVCATRANMNEWRQCLQFASQWHGVSLQSAYRLWQLGQIMTLAPPANQWLKSSEGQPMPFLDQCKADQKLSLPFGCPHAVGQPLQCLQ